MTEIIKDIVYVDGESTGKTYEEYKKHLKRLIKEFKKLHKVTVADIIAEEGYHALDDDTYITNDGEVFSYSTAKVVGGKLNYKPLTPVIMQGDKGVGFTRYDATKKGARIEFYDILEDLELVDIAFITSTTVKKIKQLKSIILANPEEYLELPHYNTIKLIPPRTAYYLVTGIVDLDLDA